ncbi:aspartyl protease family protein [Flavobacterium sp. CG_23.5]|uniref:retropepsin-like aspartic protease family protein n=1 Tax=Flavobacterium sp. CG_23.5 TaxID=2760708 RepID=UPI001AE8498A|nr:retropepsin-like aspartic protease [Flavobacterium sp. CG_23.5]MBP2281700.1 aspartyl protease family protein [Flavobacterium sp. CG_23.5]
MRKIILSVLAIILSMFFVDCNGCSRSGRNNSREHRSQTSSSLGHGKTMIVMSEEQGIYKIPVFINETKMNFIFDTGASDITISDVEAMFLYRQGKLLKEDILGSQQYQIADGSIAEGTIINLRTVKLGNRTLKNVKASIVHNNEAPLLLGQSALAQFGRVSIDYKKNEITFE